MTLAEKIAAADLALHKLMTGSMREEVRYDNGDLVRYTPADIEKLRGYIAELKTEVSGGMSRGAIGVVF
jgi:gpW protein